MVVGAVLFLSGRNLNPSDMLAEELDVRSFPLLERHAKENPSSYERNVALQHISRIAYDTLDRNKKGAFRRDHGSDTLFRMVEKGLVERLSQHLDSDSPDRRYSCMLALNGILSGIQLQCTKRKVDYCKHLETCPFNIVFTSDGTETGIAQQQAYLKRDDIYESFITWWSNTRRLYVDVRMR